MSSRNEVLLWLALLPALAGCTIGDRSIGPGTSLAATARAPVVVDVYEVRQQEQDGQVIPAILSASATATVLARRDGIITNLSGQEGALVTRGEELARLGEDDLRAQLEQAQFEVNRLAVEERQYEAMVKVSQSEFAQESALHRDGLTSNRQLERTQYKLEGSAQELEKARLATRTARSRLEAAELEIAKCIIRAPLSGIITHRYATLGTNIVRNEKLFEVARISPLEVRFRLPLSDQTRVAPGRLLRLSLAGDDHVVVHARIRRSDPVAEATSNTRGYLADVIGGSGLIPGMAVSVHLSQMDLTATLAVPRAAFRAATELRPGNNVTLFVLDGDRAIARTVRVSAAENGQVEISSGLAPGDLVILAPPTALESGDPVHVR